MKKLLLYLLPLVVAFSSCTDDVLNQKATLRIEGVTINDETGQTMEGVAVELIGENSANEIVYSNQDGFFTLGVRNTGSYLIRMKKEGYLTVVRSVSVLNFDMQIAQEQTISIGANMYPLGESIKTIVMSEYSYDAIPMPLANAPFSIKLGSFNEPITGMTDESGNLEVNGLPRGMYIELVFDFERDGLTYNYTIPFSLPNNDLPQYIVIRPQVEIVPLIVTATNLVDANGVPVKDFVPNTSIEVTFNQPVDVEGDYYYINLGYDWDLEVNQILWSNNNTVMTINYSGMDYGMDYYLEMQLKTVNEPSSYLDMQLNFETKETAF